MPIKKGKFPRVVPGSLCGGFAPRCVNLTKLPPEVISLEFDAGWRDKRGPGSGFRIQPRSMNGFFSVSGFLLTRDSNSKRKSKKRKREHVKPTARTSQFKVTGFANGISYELEQSGR